MRGGLQDVLVTLLNNLKVQERQNRVCTTVAIAIVAETCSPFTVLPALMNEYKVRARSLIRRCDVGTVAASALLPGVQKCLLAVRNQWVNCALQCYCWSAFGQQITQLFASMQGVRALECFSTSCRVTAGMACTDCSGVRNEYSLEMQQCLSKCFQGDTSDKSCARAGVWQTICSLRCPSLTPVTL